MKNNSKDLELEFNLPEFSKKDIKISLNKNSAEVNASKKAQKKIKKKDYYHEEKSFRSFNYTTTLPNINPKKAKIIFDKGKLKIKAPKQ